MRSLSIAVFFAVYFKIASPTCLDMAFDLAFKDPSYGPPYSYDRFIDYSARTNYFLPQVVVQILDANNNVYRDAENYRVTVSLSTAFDGNSLMLPATVNVIRGEAVFRDILKFQNVPNDVVRLKFDCNPPLTRNQSLYSEAFTVVLDERSVQNVRIQFADVDSFFTNIPLTGDTLKVWDTPLNVRQVTIGFPLPRFELQVVYPWGAKAVSEVGDIIVEVMQKNGASSDPSFATNPGGKVAVKNGSAVFENFIITAKNFKPKTYLRFTFNRERPPGSTAGENPYLGLIPIIVNKEPVPMVSLKFGTVRESFLHDQLVTTTATGGIELPPISIYIIDSAGHRDGSSPNLVVKAVCSMGDTLLHNEAPLKLGKAVFGDLIFPVTPYETWASIAFYVLSTKITYKLWSCPIKIEREATIGRNYIRFLPDSMRSFFSYDNQNDRVAQTNRLLPEIIVELMLSSHQRDVITTQTTLKVTGASSTFPFIDGVAIVRGLYLTTEGKNVITFSCVSTNLLPCPYGSLLTATVTTLKKATTSYAIEFDRNGFSMSPFGTPIYGALNFKLPRFTVNMIDAGGQFDPTNSETIITASAEGCFFNGATITMYKGQAIFDNLVLLDSGDQPSIYLTFTAGNEGRWPVAGKTISTGQIIVEEGSSDGYVMGFSRKESYIQFEGHSVVASAGIPIPRTITVQILYRNGSASSFAGQLDIYYASVWINQTTIKGGKAAITGLTLPARSTRNYQVLSFCATFGENMNCIYSGPLYIGSTAFPMYFLDMSSPLPSTTIVETKNLTDQTIQIFDHNFKAASSLFSTWTVQLTSGEPPQIFPFKGNNNSRTDRIILDLTSPTIRWNFTILPWLKIYTPVLTFTANPNRLSETSIRNFVDNVITTGSINRRPITTKLQVLVFEILTDYTAFTGGGNISWFQVLSQILRLDADRIEVMSIAQGSAFLDYTTKRRWKGTRVELRFSSPSYENFNRAPSDQLVDAFLNIDLSLIPQLMIRRVVRIEQDTVCDIYRFKAQVSAAKHCVYMYTSVKEGRCECFEDFFEVMGQYCTKYTGMVEVCNIISPCDANVYPLMEKTCATVDDGSLLQMLIVGGFLGLLFVIIGGCFALKSGYFERKSRAIMNDHSIQTTSEPQHDHVYSML